MKIVLIDHLDSFTWNLVQLLSECGAECTVLPAENATIEEIRRRHPDALVFSPGPHRPEDAPLSCAALREFRTKLPILGVCLGHQCMGAAFGGTRSVAKAPLPVYGETSDVFHTGTDLFKGVPSPFRAARYHALAVKTVPDDFLPLAWTGTKTRPEVLMAMKHAVLPIFGVQFHPESFLTEHGHRIVENFLSFRR